MRGAYSAAGHPAHPSPEAAGQAAGAASLAAAGSDFLLSVLWNPLPLKWTPTG
jgi:hypothetical protein